MKELEQFLVRAEALLARIEPLLPAAPAAIDWDAAHAFRWRVGRDGRGRLQPVAHAGQIRLDDLHNIGPQKEQIEQNTLQFVKGKPANNVLLTGARGTGKSSLIKACLNQYAQEGLRLIVNPIAQRIGNAVAGNDREAEAPHRRVPLAGDSIRIAVIAERRQVYQWDFHAKSLSPGLGKAN